MRDEVNEPLGIIPARPSPWAKIGPALSRGGIGIGAVALCMGAYALWHRAQTNDGEPFAVARIEPAPAPPLSPPQPPPSAPSPPRPPPAVASPAATQVSAVASVSSGAQLEASSGVKVIRGGGGSATNALIIEVPQAHGVRQTSAPDKRLVERSNFGLLPRVGADGARPADVYARPVVERAELKGAPRVAVMVGGLGIDEAGTIAAIDKLPPAVSLAFAPYGARLDRDPARAREAGHEILLQAPMEPFGSAAAGPGPHTLTTAASEAENLESLHWLMSRFTGYIGITNYLGGKLSADAHAFSPVLAEMAARGLDYLDDGSSPRSLAREIAAKLSLPAAAADVVVDAAPTAEAIEGALARLEAQARRQGSAVGVATALPITVEHIARWAATLESRGISLVPISAAIARAPPPSARGNP
ncbi:MAG TPA: divergent polysaccharide deacetylase family protein [Roseiarcus sp.]